MAIQTKPCARISAHSVVLLEVFMEYDDSDFQEINDDGDPDDFRVVRWFGTNHTDRDFRIELMKGNGQHWQDRLVPPGDFSQSAGGAVKYESDIPVWRYS